MKHLLSSITLLLLSTLAFGQVPNTFSSGETISSSKINANFSFLADAMGSGKLEAMMICKNMGYPRNQYGDSDYNDFVYGECISTDNSTDNAEESSSIKRRSTRKRKRKSCNYYEKNQDVIRENTKYINRNKKLKQANRFFEKTIRDKLNEMKDLDKILKQNSLKIREQIDIISL